MPGTYAPLEEPSWARLALVVAVPLAVLIWHQVHICEGVRIGEGCVISKGVYIDAGVTIGNRVKIQNGVSVDKGVVLEDDTFVGPSAAFTNDLMPRSFASDWKVVPTIVRRGASIGANATVVCGVTLGMYSIVAAGATAATSVPPRGLVVGNPARLAGYVCRRGHRMQPLGSCEQEDLFECASCRERLGVSYDLTLVEADVKSAAHGGGGATYQNRPLEAINPASAATPNRRPALRRGPSFRRA